MVLCFYAQMYKSKITKKNSCMFCIILYCCISYCVVLYLVVLCCSILYYIVSYCIMFYYIVLYCIVLYCCVSYLYTTLMRAVLYLNLFTLFISRFFRHCMYCSKNTYRSADRINCTVQYLYIYAYSVQ